MPRRTCCAHVREHRRLLLLCLKAGLPLHPLLREMTDPPARLTFATAITRICQQMGVFWDSWFNHANPLDMKSKKQGCQRELIRSQVKHTVNCEAETAKL